MNPSRRSRLDGLDMARFLAFVGMVIVNFKLVMGAGDDAGWLGNLTTLLEGRAAATFVVLAGVGLALSQIRSRGYSTVLVTIKRAAFLLVIGLINMLIFDADILHYYAIYFLLGALLLGLGSRALFGVIVGINVIFFLMVLVLDYEAGWNWVLLTYEGFWTPDGFVRNLFFNGWHPVLPWLSFLLYGVILGRLPLSEKATQWWLMISGGLMVLAAEFTQYQLRPILHVMDPVLVDLVTTEAIPPMPLYILVSMGVASMVIGLCLYLAGQKSVLIRVRWCLPAGRQMLSLYIAHIVIGMGLLEVFGLLGGQSIGLSLIVSLVFCAFAAIYAVCWSRYFKYGPVETLMRKTAG